MATIRLGLIGDNIRRSQSPLLHVLAGRLCGLDVSYEPLIPADLGLDFDAVFDRCRKPVFAALTSPIPIRSGCFRAFRSAMRWFGRSVHAISRCSRQTAPPLEKTRITPGLSRLSPETSAISPPGIVAIAGAGGVGKAVAFGLADLGADELRLFDPDTAKVVALRDSLAAMAPRLDVRVVDSIEEAAVGADGLVNCTPFGMAGYPGTAIPRR